MVSFGIRRNANAQRVFDGLLHRLEGFFASRKEVSPFFLCKERELVL